MCIIGLVMSFKAIQLEKQNKVLYNETKESCNMRFNRTNGLGVNGLYVKEKYYCVWVEGRTLEEINGTKNHELCHVNIGRDVEHFCGGKTDGNISQFK